MIHVLLLNNESISSLIAFFQIVESLEDIASWNVFGSLYTVNKIVILLRTIDLSPSTRKRMDWEDISLF